MSCEGAKALTDQMVKEWLRTEQDMLQLRGPILGKLVELTDEELAGIKDADERYARSGRNAIAALTAWLAARKIHRESSVSG